MPFFLFDLDRATSGGAGEGDATDFLKETFFTSFDEKRKSQLKEVGASAMARNNVEAKLATILFGDDASAIIDYMKGLSPSGVELEILSLGNFDFKNPESTPTNKIDKFLNHLLSRIKAKKDCDYVHALLNCCLRLHYDLLMSENDLIS